MPLHFCFSLGAFPLAHTQNPAWAVVVLQWIQATFKYNGESWSCMCSECWPQTSPALLLAPSEKHRRLLCLSWTGVLLTWLQRSLHQLTTASHEMKHHHQSWLEEESWMSSSPILATFGIIMTFAREWVIFGACLAESWPLWRQLLSRSASLKMSSLKIIT